MNVSFTRALIVLSVAALAPSVIFGGVDAARADDVPDALSVEWQGKKPCEKLFDDEHVRGPMHVPTGCCARLPLTPGLP